MSVLIDKQTQYQRIRIVTHPLYTKEYQLYLDGAWQFSSDVEFKYHESLVTIPMALSPSHDKTVLICGGGDGMALREATRFKGLNRATLCEIDPEMIALFSGPFSFLNQDAYRHPRASTHCGDAIAYAREQMKRGNKYDVVVLDFPSPSNTNKQKSYESLYRPEIIDNFLNIMPDWGILSAQVSLSPSELVPMLRHLLRHDFFCWQFDVYYDERGGHDSFLIASKINLDGSLYTLPDGLRFVTKRHVELAVSDTTHVREKDLEYFNLFCFDEQVDLE